MVPIRPKRSATPASRAGRSSRAGNRGRDDGRVRLQKALAEAGIASRRACEELIVAGEVEVDGEVVRTLPCLVDPAVARIEVRGVPVDIRPASVAARTVMVFKPRGVVSTNRDPFRRRRAIDIVPHAPGERLYPVGRLDIDSSGLLLLTNDGELANRLTHPRYGVHKGYEVMVTGRIDERDLEKLKRGVFLAHRRRPGAARASAERLDVLRRDRDRSVLFIELSEGRNRQIRRMLEQLGHDVKRLRRVSLGPLKLSGLKPGEWRELSPSEADALKRTAFGSSRKTAPPPKRASYPKSRPQSRGKARGQTPTPTPTRTQTPTQTQSPAPTRSRAASGAKSGASSRAGSRVQSQGHSRGGRGETAAARHASGTGSGTRSPTRSRRSGKTSSNATARRESGRSGGGSKKASGRGRAASKRGGR